MNQNPQQKLLRDVTVQEFLELVKGRDYIFAVFHTTNCEACPPFLDRLQKNARDLGGFLQSQGVEHMVAVNLDGARRLSTGYCVGEGYIDFVPSTVLYKNGRIKASARFNRKYDFLKAWLIVQTSTP
jgi:hypothetical protein